MIDTDVDGDPDLGSIVPGATVELVFVVEVPAGVSDGTIDVSEWIDHVMVRGCGNEAYRYSRVLDEQVYLRTDDDGWLDSSLSDHYGLMLQIVRD